jgi:hypothetical protein
MNSAWMHRRTALLVVLGMSLIGGSVGSQGPSEQLVSVKPRALKCSDFSAASTRGCGWRCGWPNR